MENIHQEFLDRYEDVRKPLLEAILLAINEECPNLTKIIKWNAPSFCDNG